MISDPLIRQVLKTAIKSNKYNVNLKIIYGTALAYAYNTIKVESKGLIVLKRLLPILLLLILMTVVIGTDSSFAQNSITKNAQQIRSLLAFEMMPRDITLPPDSGDILRESGFDRVVTLLHDNQSVQALNDAYMLGLRLPALWAEPSYHLLLAECLFSLGIAVPDIQFTMAKPIYVNLMRRYPRWENQPLVLFRLATIYDRQGFIDDALATYGLLIDWYPDDLFADQARLGMIMTSLRSGFLRNTEQQAMEVLKMSKDAQIRYHASLGLAIARHRLERNTEALSEIDRTVNWPEDLTYLEDFELFSFGEIQLQANRLDKSTKAFVTYLDRFPEGRDRPMVILYLSEEARRQQQYENALVGLKYLMQNFPDDYSGMKAKYIMAELRLEAYPNIKDKIIENYLQTVRDQNDYRKLNQQAALLLGKYLLNVDQPIDAIDNLIEVFDNPIDLSFATRALQLIHQSFSRFMESNQSRPMEVAKTFVKYRTYIDVPATTEAMYTELGNLLYQNLQPDTLFAIADENPLAQTYPRRAMIFRAKAEIMRGNDEKALANLAAFFEGSETDEEKPQADRLSFEARLLWAKIEINRGNAREALRQIGLARTDAQTQMDQGLLELESGLILLNDGAGNEAAARLSNAIQIFGEPVAEGLIHELQMDATYNLGAALFTANRYQESLDAFTRFLTMKADDYRAQMASLRIAQIKTAMGYNKEEAAQTETATIPAWFWPRSEWSMSNYLLWLNDNESRFGNEPDWEKLQ